MADFSNLKQTVRKLESRRYTFFEVEGEPWLEVVPATEDNAGYFDALLSRQLRNRRMTRRQVRASDLKRNRMDDIQLYAKHVVKAWGQVTDAKGNAVLFDKADCQDFLRALPAWVFDGLREFAADPSTFEERIDAEEVGKN